MVAKTKLNSIESLISKDLIDSNTSHDEIFLIYNAVKEYDGMKKEITDLKDLTVHQRFLFCL